MLWAQSVTEDYIKAAKVTKQTNKQTNKQQQKSETELTASVLKKDPKTHTKLKERFSIGRNRTKRANFLGSPLFQATNNIKTKNQFNLSRVIEMLGGLRKEKGTRLKTAKTATVTDVVASMSFWMLLFPFCSEFVFILFFFILYPFLLLLLLLYSSLCCWEFLSNKIPVSFLRGENQL